MLDNFILTLRKASLTLKLSDSSKRDLKSIIGFVETAGIALELATLNIAEITRNQIKMLLTQIDISKGESAHRYNKVRSYLMIIFNELVELELIESDPVKDVSKMKGIQKIRKTLSKDQRKVNHRASRS